jgi:hypothetical protein
MSIIQPFAFHPIILSNPQALAPRSLAHVTFGLALQVYISPGTLHSASINSVAWAPHELGLILAAGSSDGTVSITEYSSTSGTWESTKVCTHGAAHGRGG